VGDTPVSPTNTTRFPDLLWRDRRLWMILSGRSSAVVNGNADPLRGPPRRWEGASGWRRLSVGPAPVSAPAAFRSRTAVLAGSMTP
jgi:hypothetical protein